MSLSKHVKQVFDENLKFLRGSYTDHIYVLCSPRGFLFMLGTLYLIGHS